MVVAASYHEPVQICELVLRDGARRAHTRVETRTQRPDIAIPYLNVTTLDKSAVAPGFVFVAPFKNAISGPLIYDQDGGLVWTGSDGFAAAAGAGPHVYIFEPCLSRDTSTARRHDDEHHLCMLRSINDGGSGRGHAFILDASYEMVREIRFSGASPAVDLHELRLVEGPTGDNQTSAILTQYRPIAADLSRYGIPGVGWVHDSVFQEQRLSDGAVIFEWAASDHIAFDEAAIVFYSGVTPNDPWDYFHINSVQKLEDGDYLVGARHTSAIYRISGRDGSVVWRLGGRKSDFDMIKGPLDHGTRPPAVKRESGAPAGRKRDTRRGGDEEGDGVDDGWFYYQHHATLLRNETGLLTFSIFDNGRTQSREARSYSRGLLLTVDERARTASVRAEYHSPAAPREAQLAGSMQVLENGNVLVSWGNTGCLSEYTDDNRPVFEACLRDSPTPALYRAHKTAAWRGRPRTRPAIAAFSRHAAGGGVGAKTAVYLSWNGATEVAHWTVYGSLNATGAEGPWETLGTHARIGFETTVVLADHWPVVRAEALDASGHVLAISALAKTFSPTQLHGGCDDMWCFPQLAVAEPSIDAVKSGDVTTTDTQFNSTGLYIQVAVFAVLAVGMGSLIRRRLRISK